MSDRRQCCWWAAGILFLLLSNRWMGVPQGIELVGATDSYSYLEMVRAAPEIPRILPFHRAQRWFFPWLVGSAGRLLPGAWSPAELARAVSGAALALAFLFFVRLVRTPAAPDALGIVTALLFLWNPYTFRYYLLAPAMLPDIFFVLGLIWICLGMERSGGRAGTAYFWAGLLVSGLARQTVLLLAPLFLVAAALERRRSYFGAAALSGGLYWLTGLAVPDAASSTNLDHLVGLFSWLREAGSLGGAGGRQFFEYAARVALPYLLVCGLFGPSLWRTWRPAALRRSGLRAAFGSGGFYLLGWLALASQPVLAGPVVTAGSGPRLAALALPLALLAGLKSATPGLRASVERHLPWILLGAAGVSLHHLYSRWQPAGPAGYLAAQLVLPLLVWILVRRR